MSLSTIFKRDPPLLQFVSFVELEDPPLYVPLHPYEGKVSPLSLLHQNGLLYSLEMSTDAKKA